MNERIALDLAERWFRQRYRFAGAIDGVAAADDSRGWYVELRCEQLNQLVAVAVDRLGQVQLLGEGLPTVTAHDSTGESRDLEAVS